MSYCESTLWSPAGARARAYLEQRGLREHTLQTCRVGFQPHYRVYEPAARWGLDGASVYVPRGIVLPWLSAGQIGHVQVRTSPHDQQERYLSLRGDHPSLFGADTLASSTPIILLERVLDTLLVCQEAGDLLGTASLGSCRKLPSWRALALLERCRPLLEAFDADREGEAGALRLRQLLPDLVRVRPPAGKDATHYWQQGGSVRTSIERVEGTGEFPSWEYYVLWLPEEGVRYVAGRRQARLDPAEADDAPDPEPVGARDREKVGIWLPRGLRQRLRIHAAVLDREISEVIAQSITEYLDRHDQQRTAEGLLPIPLR